MKSSVLPGSLAEGGTPWVDTAKRSPFWQLIVGAVLFVATAALGWVKRRT